MTDDSDELRETYLSWTRDSLDELDTLIARLRASESDAATFVEEMHGITHNIKGMGTSFGYPLMTDSAGLICTYFRTLMANGGAPSSSIVDAHCKVMRTILDNDIRGDGGETGAALLSKLERITEVEATL